MWLKSLIQRWNIYLWKIIGRRLIGTEMKRFLYYIVWVVSHFWSQKATHRSYLFRGYYGEQHIFMGRCVYTCQKLIVVSWKRINISTASFEKKLLITFERNTRNLEISYRHNVLWPTFSINHRTIPSFAPICVPKWKKSPAWKWCVNLWPRSGHRYKSWNRSVTLSVCSVLWLSCLSAMDFVK